MGKCCLGTKVWYVCASNIFSHCLFLVHSPRGDGFPLANMLALVSVDNKELIPVLAAHIYTVCPTAIPTLPTPSSTASEEELMQSLGMLKGKNGEFETFERFLARTEVRRWTQVYAFSISMRTRELTFFLFDDSCRA
jgi:hypothetical protein